MPPIPGRSSYKYASPETWELIRTAYMRGESGPSLARRFNVGLWNLYKKAMDEGWSRRECALRAARGEAAPGALSPYSAAADEAPPGETWTSLKDPVPPSMRRWPHPLPGMGPMRRPAWAPPAGYGPMPPHLVPPVPRPPAPAPGPASDDETDPPSAAPSAGEAAEQAVAAAARAVAAGRYEEAERLGRLAVTLRKLADGAGGARRAAPLHGPEEEGEDGAAEDATPEGDKLLNCTMNTCAVQTIYRRAQAAVSDVFDRANTPLGADLLDWTGMGEALGAAIDPEVAEIAAALRAEGMAGRHGRIGALLGPIPRRPRAPEAELFRER